MRTLAELLGLSRPFSNSASPPPFTDWTFSGGPAPYAPHPWTATLDDPGAPAPLPLPDFATGGLLGTYLAARATDSNGSGGILGPVGGMFSSSLGPITPSTTPETDALATPFGEWSRGFVAIGNDTPSDSKQYVNLAWAPPDLPNPQVRETPKPQAMPRADESTQTYPYFGLPEMAPLRHDARNSVGLEYPWLQTNFSVAKLAGYSDPANSSPASDPPRRLATGLIDSEPLTFNRGGNDNFAPLRSPYAGMDGASANNFPGASFSPEQSAWQPYASGLSTDYAPRRPAKFIPLDLVNYHEAPVQPLNSAPRHHQNEFRAQVRLDFPGTVNPAGQEAQNDRFELPYEPEPYRRSAQIQLAQYVHPSAITGVPDIDGTSKRLADTLKESADVLGRVAPLGVAANLFGIQVHVDFGRRIKALDLPGIGVDGVEQSFSIRDLARYGAINSIRTDVYLRNRDGIPIAIYDVKTGKAQLSPARIRELRAEVGGDNIPVFELRLEDLTAWRR